MALQNVLTSISKYFPGDLEKINQSFISFQDKFQAFGAKQAPLRAAGILATQRPLLDRLGEAGEVVAKGITGFKEEEITEERQKLITGGKSPEEAAAIAKLKPGALAAFTFISGGIKPVGQMIGEQLMKEISALKLGPRQVSRLAQIYIGKEMAEFSEQEGKKFLKLIQGIKTKPGQKPTIPRSTVIARPEIFTKTFNEVGVIEQFQTPNAVFRKMGATDEIARPLDIGYETMKRNINENLGKVKEWQKRVGYSKFNFSKNKEQSKRIFDAINNPETAKAVPSENEIRVVDEIKNLFDDYANRLDIVLEQFGLSKVNRRSNYITNLLTNEVRIAVRQNKPLDSTLLSLLDRITPKQVFDPFLLRRSGGLPIQKDVWKAVEAYIAVTEKKLALDPVLRQVSPFIKLLPMNAQRYARWYVGELLGRPSALDQLVDATANQFLRLFGMKKIRIPAEVDRGLDEMVLEVPKFVVNRVLSKSINKVKMANYMSFIGMNLRTALLNLTQPMGTIASLPGKPWENIYDFTVSWTKAWTQMFSRRAWDKMKKVGVIDEVVNLLDKEMAVGMGRLGDITLWNMKVTEFLNRVSSAEAGRMAFRRLLQKEGVNLPERELLALGKELSDLVNFRYGIQATPKAFANPIGRLYWQYNTFAVKHAGFLLTLMRNLPRKGIMKDFVKAASEGKGVEFLQDFGPPTRTAILKYFLIASGVSAAAYNLGATKLWQAIFKGPIPSQVEALPELVEAIWEGDGYKIRTAVGRIATPPALSKGLKGLIPLRAQTERTIKAQDIMQFLGLQPLPKEKKLPSLPEAPSKKKLPKPPGI